MTLQSSGAISLANVQTEFGGSNPISMSEYYGAGGAPGSGVLKLSDFYGRSSADVTMVAFSSDNVSSGTSLATGAVHTVSGIDTTITLRISVTATGSDGGVAYRKNGGGYTNIVGGDPDVDITVVNGDTLQFRGFLGIDPPTQTSGYTLRNVSDGLVTVGSGNFDFT